MIERAVVMGSSEVVTPDDLADLLPDTPATGSGESEGGFHEAVRQARRRLIATALEQASGNVTEAAHALKLHPNYLHRLITNLRTAFTHVRSMNRPARATCKRSPGPTCPAAAGAGASIHRQLHRDRTACPEKRNRR